MSDLVFLNGLVNQPDILAAMAPGFDAVDMAGFFERPGNILVGDEQGAALFGLTDQPGVYEGHYLFPALARPKRVVHRCRRFISLMFTANGAEAITGQVAADNLHARAMTRALGFTSLGYSVSREGRSIVNYVLERNEWAASLAASLEA